MKTQADYILKPDWEPDPEYIDIPLRVVEGRIRLKKPYKNHCLLLYELDNFAQYRGIRCLDDGQVYCPDLQTNAVGELIAKGLKPFARFAKDAD